MDFSFKKTKQKLRSNSGQVPPEMRTSEPNWREQLKKKEDKHVKCQKRDTTSRME